MLTLLRNLFLGKVIGRLRYPQLFGLLMALFLADLVIPDLIPFADEILLGLLTALVGSIRDRQPVGVPIDPLSPPPQQPPAAAGANHKPPVKNVTPAGGR